MNMFFYSLFLVAVGIFIGIPSAYLLAEKRKESAFVFLEIVNIYILMGVSILVISMNFPVFFELFIIGLLIYMRTLNFFLKILFGYDVRHKVMFLSLGYTRREYFLKYLVPRNVRLIVSHILETFGTLLLAFTIGKSSLSSEVVGTVQLILIFMGMGIFILEKLRVSKRYSH
ncbi:MAG: hypothetical protein PWQ20_1516 [Thermotogaceae bacterium]|jgi:hypothetical protein|nr:hypothetical protein [Thermotogaceae bacterium]MDN5338446.1 hypothetical protein [Thermotogaceae bacterium]